MEYTKIAALATTTAVAISVVASYYYSDRFCIEEKTHIERDPYENLVEFEIEAGVEYEIDNIPFEVCWAVSTDNWRFSDGGYFVTDENAVLPSVCKQELNGGNYKWIKSKVPLKLWVTEKVIKKSDK